MLRNEENSRDKQGLLTIDWNSWKSSTDYSWSCLSAGYESF